VSAWCAFRDLLLVGKEAVGILTTEELMFDQKERDEHAREARAGVSEHPGLKKLALLAKEVEEAGYTPFDLCSWECLIELNEMSKTSSGWVDFTFSHEIHALIREAFNRKAKMLDKKHNTNFYSRIYDSFTR
jgi:hypothetical protein